MARSAHAYRVVLPALTRKRAVIPAAGGRLRRVGSPGHCCPAHTPPFAPPSQKRLSSLTDRSLGCAPVQCGTRTEEDFDRLLREVGIAGLAGPHKGFTWLQTCKLFQGQPE